MPPPVIHRFGQGELGNRQGKLISFFRAGFFAGLGVSARQNARDVLLRRRILSFSGHFLPLVIDVGLEGNGLPQV